MRLRERAALLRRLAGSGVYPYQFAGLLLLPLRRVVLSPADLAACLHLDAAARVLEVGAGPGYFSVEIARRLPQGHLELLDLQPEMLARACRRLERADLRNVGYTVADAAHLPFAAASFDVALLVTVLGELADRAGAMRELTRVLRAGGLLSITEQAGDPDRLTPAALAALVEPAGFEAAQTYRRRLSTTSNFRSLARGMPPHDRMP
jgi:ubiquinone/menaquinone biosynthesis C-methylase UbiE